VAHIHRTPRAASRYAVRFDPPLVAGRDGSAGRDALTHRMAERLSQIVVEHADEWYVFQPEWRSTDGR
jgi:hypothetical protein